MKQDNEMLNQHLDARLQPYNGAIRALHHSAMNTTVSDPARDPSICLRLVCHRFENVPPRHPQPEALSTSNLQERPISRLR